MQLEIKTLRDLQEQLDFNIMENHQLQRSDTRQRRILALLVELGELANECRSFKYWSKKGPSAHATILEEYVDGIHFILSLGIDLGDQQDAMPMNHSPMDRNALFIEVYRAVLALDKAFTHDNYVALFDLYLQLGVNLGCSADQIAHSYLAKNQKNHERQANNY